MAIAGDTYEFHEKAFYDLTVPIAAIETIYDGCRWSEGPVWFNDGGYLIWSDIPNNRMLRWVPESGVTVYRQPSNYVNGNTRDLEGRMVSCSHGARAVLRTEPDGTITTLVSHHQGKRLNSPNDVVVRSDGTIWFTDPTYGIISDYEGYKADPEQDGCFVYRYDPQTDTLDVVTKDFTKPNGLAFSIDETQLFIADSGKSHDPDCASVIRCYDTDGKTLSNGRVFCELETGIPDGFRFDTNGNLWTSAGAGINCYDPAGTLLGRINLPQSVSNLTFGGERRNRLFITSTQAVYSVFVGATGAQRP
ncbi:gluconolactonase [Devosia pacifica]|uniref:Gluconolactonase n=1 Tax=Devosia pacifica TaxID=1335967 RepID=A0A918VVG0_9HYPH|nr:SMP-30/gluconolactonase/LRE family protein [Devosia pacifica]GHA27952.1 gluconolactonase [Devosia pacifica]